MTQVLEHARQIDAVLSLGSGNNETGVSRQTIYNGIHAANVAREFGARIVIASGYAPGHTPGLMSEADAQAEIIGTMLPDMAILTEPDSTSTHENVENTSEYIDELGISRLGIVGARGHIARAEHLLKMRHGDHLEIIPFETPEKPGRLKLLEQKILLGVAKFAYRKTKPHDQVSFNTGGVAYAQSISSAKKTVNKVIKDGQYSS